MELGRNPDCCRLRTAWGGDKKNGDRIQKPEHGEKGKREETQQAEGSGLDITEFLFFVCPQFT